VVNENQVGAQVLLDHKLSTQLKPLDRSLAFQMGKEFFKASTLTNIPRP
jgi:hypothetical protein